MHRARLRSAIESPSATSSLSFDFMPLFTKEATKGVFSSRDNGVPANVIALIKHRERDVRCFDIRYLIFHCCYMYK